jgi:hypothetical protein
VPPCSGDRARTAEEAGRDRGDTDGAPTAVDAAPGGGDTSAGQEGSIAPAPPTRAAPLSGNSLPAPPDGDDGDVLWQELVWRFSYYNGAATRHRIWYQVLKVITLLLGAAVTVLAARNSPAGVTAGLAAAGVAVEGISQLFQLHSQWISFRRVAELLRQHAFDYAARVAPYDGPDRRDLLAKAIRTITANENATWAKAMDKPGSP